MANKIDQNKQFFDLWSTTYDFAPFQFWMKGFHKPVFDEIDFENKIKILDISCGTGELLKELTNKDKKNNLTLKGIDLSAKMLAIAQKKLSPKIILEQQNVLELQEKDNMYDYVISTEAFHHYPDQLKALQEMARVAKKNGKIIITDINFFVRPIHWLFQKIEPGCVYVNNRQEMKWLFEQAGLKHIIQERIFVFAIMTTGSK